MTDTERLLRGAEACRVIGAYWRHDWSEFDGRTLRSQLEEVARFLLDGSHDIDLSQYDRYGND